MKRTAQTCLFLLTAMTVFAQPVPNVTADLKLSFDPTMSRFLDENSGNQYPVRNLTGTAHAQILNGVVTVQGLSVQFDAFICTPLPTCTNFKWRTVTASFNTFTAPATRDPILGGTRINATPPDPSGSVKIEGEAPETFDPQSAQFSYVGPPPLDTPVTSYEVDFAFTSRKLGTSVSVNLLSNQFQQSAIAATLSNATPAGATLWFNSNGDFKKPADGTTISIRHSLLTINQTSYSVPDADIVFSATAACSTTRFDSSHQRWITTMPVRGDDEVFLSGVEIPLSSPLPKGAAVTWTSTVYSSTPVSFGWRWGAAAFTTFTPDYNFLLVKPGSETACAFNNDDHAGTPEIYPSAIAGGTGSGGTNRTGDFTPSNDAVVIRFTITP